MPDSTWVVIANASTARIYGKNGQSHLSLITEFDHPASRKKARDLTTDGAGRYRARGGLAGGIYSSRTNPKEVEADHFANQLAKFLDHHHKLNDFKKLLLVMAPPFQGLLKNHIGDQLRHTISGEIPKDYHTATAKELEKLCGKRF